MSAIQQLEIDGIPHPEPKQLAPTPMHLIELAVQKGAAAAELAILMDLQLKWQANEARLKFEGAFGVFKANKPRIDRTKHVSFANKDGKLTEYDHAELDKITDLIGTALLAVGIVHKWRTSDAGGKTTVTCVLSGFGHSEEAATLSGPADTSGGKNSIQAIGSTVSYLQRYTLLAACGLAAKGMDDDGKTEGMSEAAIADYCIAMQDASDFQELKPIFAECWGKAKTANDANAQERFRKVYEEKKRSFRQ